LNGETLNVRIIQFFPFKLLEETQMAYYVKHGYFIEHLEELLIKSKSVINIIKKELAK